MIGNIYSLPIPNHINKHYFIIQSKNGNDYLLLSFSSVKYYEDGTEKYYDKSCIFYETDNIKSKDGNLIINRKSYIRFDLAKEIKYEDLYKLEKYYIGKLSNDLIQKIKENAKFSKDIKKIILNKYF